MGGGRDGGKREGGEVGSAGLTNPPRSRAAHFSSIPNDSTFQNVKNPGFSDVRYYGRFSPNEAVYGEKLKLCIVWRVTLKWSLFYQWFFLQERALSNVFLLPVQVR